MRKIQVALQNIDIVVSNVQMKRSEHDQLKQDLILVTQRCQLADELEKEKKPKKVKVPNKIAKKLGKKGKKHGRTDK